MEEMQDPTPISPDDVDPNAPQDPTPIAIERGKLYTLDEAARVLGRHKKLVQRWHATGRLRSRYQRVGARGRPAVLVTDEDLDAVVNRPRHGAPRPRRRYVHVTETGKRLKVRAKPVRKDA
jgi:hypothetical protein